MGGIFGGKPAQAQKSQPIKQIKVQTSAYGNTIPVIYGVSRIAGNLIWYGDFKPIRHVDGVASTGGKGGGTPPAKTISYTYTVSGIFALCHGPFYGIRETFWSGKKKRTDGGSAFTFAVGSIGQLASTYMTTKHLAQADPYSGIAYAEFNNFAIDSPSIENMSFLINGKFPIDPSYSKFSAKAKDVVTDIIKNTDYGAAPGLVVDAWTDYGNYTVAADMLLDMAIDSQSPALDVLNGIFLATNSAPLWSDGKLKIIPLGDKYEEGNGATFTPNVTPLYDLYDSDFIVSGDEEPVKVERATYADAKNLYSFEFTNSYRDYNIESDTVSDQSHLNEFGVRSGGTIDLKLMSIQSRARDSARLILQRGLYIRNKYRFRLSQQYTLLEPADIVTITDSSLGLDKWPVRITEIDESGDGDISVFAEEFPAGIGHAALYANETSSGHIPDYQVDPGLVTAPLFFEPPIELTTTGLEVWAAVTGLTSDWGGAEVWVSLDGSTYQRSSEVRGGARYGTTTSALNAGTAQTFGVSLLGNGGQILTATAQAADALTSLCWVGTYSGGEYLSVTTATLTGTNAYNLTTRTRGAYKSGDVYHIATQNFVRVDDAIAKSGPLDISMVGKTIYFKFLSFNSYGAAQKGLAEVSPYAYTITGVMAKIPPSDVTGVTVSASDDRVVLSWDSVSDVDLREYEVRDGATWATGVLLGRVRATTLKLPARASGAYSFGVAAIDTLGNYSKTPTIQIFTSTVPNAVGGLSSAISGPNYVLTWTAPASLYRVDTYEVRYGATWAGGTYVDRTKALSYSAKATHSGARVYWVAAIDIAGNVGAQTSVTIAINVAAQPTIAQQVVDNNVLLTWTATPGTLPIERYEMRRGSVFSSATVRGAVNGTFQAFFEEVSGTYTYWIVAIDTAGNYGVERSSVAIVNQPPDYVLRQDWNSTFAGTKTNATVKDDGHLLVPVTTSTTWQTHFTNSGWTTPQDQINAGYPYYMMPSTATASYVETFDYGATVAATLVTVTANIVTVTGSVTATPTLSTSVDNTTWVDNVGVTQVFATGFRYVRIKYDFTAAGGDDLAEIKQLSIKLSSKLKNDSGSGTSNSGDAGGTTVTFGQSFIDITSIIVTPYSTTSVTAVVDFVDAPNPTTFKVLLFNSTTGARVTSGFSWTARGY